MDLNVRRLCPGVTLNVRFKITRQLKVRLFVAGRLIRLAALVLGCRVKFEGEKPHGQ